MTIQTITTSRANPWGFSESDSLHAKALSHSENLMECVVQAMISDPERGKWEGSFEDEEFLSTFEASK